MYAVDGPRVAVGSVTHRLKMSPSAMSETLGSGPSVDRRAESTVRGCTHRRGCGPGMLTLGLHADHSGAVKIVVPRLIRRFFSYILDNVREATTRTNCGVLITRDGRRCRQRMGVIRSFLTTQIYKIVASLTGSASQCSRCRRLLSGGVPVIFCSHVYANVGARQIIMSSCTNSFTTIRCVVRANYGHVFFCDTTPRLRVSGGQQGNCVSTVGGCQVPIGRDVVGLYSDHRGTVTVAPTLLREPSRPSNFFTVGSRATSNVLCSYGLAKQGIPSRISVYKFASNTVTRDASPGLAAIRRRNRRINGDAVELLVSGLRKGSRKGDNGGVIHAGLIMQKAAGWVCLVGAP